MESSAFPLGARGEHPVFFPARLPWDRIRELTSVPGIVKVSGGLACTWDIAPSLATWLGVQCPVPPTESNLTQQELEREARALPGLARYRELGLGSKLRSYQKDGAMFLARRAYAMNCDPMRCVAGDATLIVNRGGASRRMLMFELVAKFNGAESKPPPGRASAGHELQGPGRVWRRDIATYVASYDEEGSIISNRIVSAHAVGRKPGFRVTTESGLKIVTSAEHQFRTPSGYARLDELQVGDEVLVRARQNATRGARSNPYRVLCVRHHPNARVYEIKRKGRANEVVYHMLKHRLIYEAQVLNGMTLEEFCARVRSGDLEGLDFLDPSTVVHHIDGDATNNRVENLELHESRSSHAALHAEEGAWRNVLWTAVKDRIQSITPVGEVEMFDLEMDDPYRNYVANDFVVHNSGKSLQALAASVLVDAKRTLIVAPALAKWVWADEIAKWLSEEPLILEGRGGTLARRYCRTCMSRGVVTDTVDGVPVEGTLAKCAACRLRNGQSNGFKIYDVNEMREFMSTRQADGSWLSSYRCTKHKDSPALRSPGSVLDCPKCQEELHQAIEASRYVIVNYDLLVAQKAADAAGRAFYREDLQGWSPVLARHHFDLCIADESHLLRGWTSDAKKKGTTRREKFIQVTEYIDRVWGLTGTPIFGYVRDLWGQLDAISKGAMSGTADRLPFNFHARYCDGHKAEYGWRADGRSLFADSELPARLDTVKIQRPRSEILSNLPPKLRQTIRIDDTRPSKKIPRFANSADASGKITRLLKSTFEAKIDTVVENVIGEVAQGNKVVVFSLLKESAERLAKAFEKEAAKTENRARMREVDLKVWLAHGNVSTQGRFEMARAFREHGGAGIFVATCDAVQVAVSLKGASSVHFAELHWNPAAMLQAEDRPYEVGTTGLTIVYYIVRGSVDEHIEQVVLPKVDTLARVVAEKEARGIKDALLGDQNETLGQLLDSLTTHLALLESPYEDGAEHQ